MSAITLHCPQCKTQVTRPAHEGGMFIRSRFIRLAPDAKTVIGCPGCGTELEVQRGKLILHRRLTGATAAAMRRTLSS